MKKVKNNKIKIILPILGVFLIVLAVILEYAIKTHDIKIINLRSLKIKNEETKLSEMTSLTNSPTITPSPTKILSPTVALETVDNMNKDYGPCAKVNVLMYHHIQDEETATKNGQMKLTVTPEFFRQHLQYIKDNGYNVISPIDLKEFFNGSKTLPTKAVMITIDDGYKDNFEVAYPILKELGIKATIFVATGLLNNPEYMSWGDLNQMKDLVYFANHTWSHHSSAGTKEKLTEEIITADKQLNEHGLNPNKIFAYPYGGAGKTAKEVLVANGYEIAFTTVHGNIMCKGKSLELPRIRVGNASLKSYGL